MEEEYGSENTVGLYGSYIFPQTNPCIAETDKMMSILVEQNGCSYFTDHTNLKELLSCSNAVCAELKSFYVAYESQIKHSDCWSNNIQFEQIERSFRLFQLHSYLTVFKHKSNLFQFKVDQMSKLLSNADEENCKDISLDTSDIAQRNISSNCQKLSELTGLFNDVKESFATCQNIKVLIKETSVNPNPDNSTTSQYSDNGVPDVQNIDNIPSTFKEKKSTGEINGTDEVASTITDSAANNITLNSEDIAYVCERVFVRVSKNQPIDIGTFMKLLADDIPHVAMWIRNSYSKVGMFFRQHPNKFNISGSVMTLNNNAEEKANSVGKQNANEDLPTSLNKDVVSTICYTELTRIGGHGTNVLFTKFLQTIQEKHSTCMEWIRTNYKKPSLFFKACPSMFVMGGDNIRLAGIETDAQNDFTVGKNCLTHLQNLLNDPTGYVHLSAFINHLIKVDQVSLSWIRKKYSKAGDFFKSATCKSLFTFKTVGSVNYLGLSKC